MAEKQIAWASGEGYITVTFSGDGNGSVSVVSDDNTSYDAREQQITIRTLLGSPERVKTILVRQEGYRIPAGTAMDFSYTGGVQEVTLPAGRYKLQCWGAQGGNVTGSYAVNGSKGGYSEGILVLTEPKTLYIFVGGQGASYTSSASQTSTSVVNGGWNGGGAGVRTSYWSDDEEDGRSFPRGGGGATDIALVTSSMSYSSGRTTRSDASLKSRIIVAGGGAGASARYTIETEDNTIVNTIDISFKIGTSSNSYGYYNNQKITLRKGYTYSTLYNKSSNIKSSAVELYVNGSWSKNLKSNYTCTTDNEYIYVTLYSESSNVNVSCSIDESYGSSSTTTSSGKSSSTQQGGGTSGKGTYPGTQSSVGSGGSFGLGANQSTTNYRYCGGGGGGGWYGGGTGCSDNYTYYVDYSGGGSGFVNIAANASYRPSGYTGLQLESGTTTAGNTSHPSISGGSETGHSGNGYAIITVL